MSATVAPDILAIIHNLADHELQSRDQARAKRRRLGQLPISSASFVKIYPINPKRSPVMSLPWDVLKEVLKYLHPSEIALLTLANKAHYEQLQNCMWEKPILGSVPSAMKFVRFFSRRPVFSHVLLPPQGPLESVQRLHTIKWVTLQLHQYEMGEERHVMDSVIRRVRKLCPQVEFRIYLNGKQTDAFWDELTATERTVITLCQVDPMAPSNCLSQGLCEGVRRPCFSPKWDFSVVTVLEDCTRKKNRSKFFLASRTTVSTG